MTPGLPYERSTTPVSSSWPFWKRLPFRFLLCYLALYSLSVFGETISFCVFLAAKRSTFPVVFPADLWQHIVPWVGAHLLHIGKIPVSIGGSGDTLYDWVQVLCELSLAAVAALVWTLLARTRRTDAAFYRWLRVGVTAMLAAQMLLYGLDKVFPLQFRDMTLARMMQPMSSKTPMGVLWDFMAASVGYTIFAGLVEVVGGILLLIPQTVTLGALLCVAAMTNVFVLNLTYDVPVKLGSGHLLLFSLFLVAPAVPRLVDIFLRNRAVPAEPETPLSNRQWINRSAIWLPVALCSVLIVIACIDGFQKLSHKRRAYALRSPLYGIWTFTSLSVTNPGKPLLTEKLMQSMDVKSTGDRWRKLIFENRNSATIELGNGVADVVDINDDGGTMTFTDSGDSTWKCLLNFQKTPAGSLEMTGTIDGNPVHAELTRQDETNFPFTKRRFHWINEW